MAARNGVHDDNLVVPISHTRTPRFRWPHGRDVHCGFRHHRHPAAKAEPLRASGSGIPASFWSGLDRDVDAVVKAPREKLADARRSGRCRHGWTVRTDGKVSFVVALHEPIGGYPRLTPGVRHRGHHIGRHRRQDRQPRRPGRVRRHQPRTPLARPIRMRSRCSAGVAEDLRGVFPRPTNLDAILFPTTIAAAPVIDIEKGSGQMSIDGGKPVPTFDTMIRTPSRQQRRYPGLSLFAGMTPGGLPVGLENRWSGRQRYEAARVGLSIEGTWARRRRRRGKSQPVIPRLDSQQRRPASVGSPGGIGIDQLRQPLRSNGAHLPSGCARRSATA